MKRKAPFQLPEGFVFLDQRDASQAFSTGDPRIDLYDLEDYYQWGLEPDTYTIVYKPEERILGVMTIELRPDHLYIAMLGRNETATQGPVGTLLVRLAEDIARQTDKEEVQLDSLDTAVAFYDEKLGYEEHARKYSDDEFGELTPKKKRLEPPPSPSSF